MIPYDSKRHRSAGQCHAEEVEKPGPYYGNFRRQRMGVDDRRHRVGGIVEAVHELESERDEQCHEQQHIGQVGRQLCAGGLNVVVQAVGDEQQSGRENPGEQDHGQRVESFIEIGPLRRLDRPR
jgi:hypothetical protein